MRFEFHAYKGDDDGVIAETAEVTTESLRDYQVAKGKAGRLAKRIKGPVDLALAGSKDWDKRYITTASPSEYHASGYRFERLT